MDDTRRRRRTFVTWRGGLRLLAAAIVVFGPIATAGWSVHFADALPSEYVSVELDQPYPEERESAAASVRDYLAVRNPVIDRLLPEGVGGTHYVEDLGGPAGMAFLEAAAIAVAANALGADWPGATELHERAHLAFAFLPEHAARLLGRLPGPHAAEYAATNATEHLAEMAGKAWEVVSPPGQFCPMLPPVELLVEYERRVPGTAGFAARYLQHLDPREVDLYGQLTALADDLSAGYRAEMDAVWTSIDARRLPDGTFRPWGQQTVRQVIEARRHQARAAGGLHRVAEFLTLPSLVVLSLAGH